MKTIFFFLIVIAVIFTKKDQEKPVKKRPASSFIFRTEQPGDSALYIFGKEYIFHRFGKPDRKLTKKEAAKMIEEWRHQRVIKEITRSI